MRAAMAPDHDVLQHGHLREETDILEGAAYPQDGTLMGFDTIERLAFEDNRALILGIDTSHAVKERRLPSPIGSDNRMNYARFEPHIHPVDRHQAAKSFRYLFCLKECHAFLPPSPQAVPTRALESSRAPLRLSQFQRRCPALADRDKFAMLDLDQRALFDRRAVMLTVDHIDDGNLAISTS